MLKFILGLSPAILGIVAGLGGASLYTVGFMLWNNFIDNPHLIELTTARVNDAATIRIQSAAQTAERLATERVRQAGEAALAEYKRATEARARAQQTDLEQRIKEYEEALVQANRACLLDEFDIEWLRGGSSSPPANPSGGTTRGSTDPNRP